MSPVTSAFVCTSTGHNQFDSEERIVLTALQERGIPVQWGSPRFIEQGKVDLSPEKLVVGPIRAVHGALRRLGVQPPEPNDYPAVLTPFLHRKVWSGVLSRAPLGTFVKPKQLKRFTGRMLYDYDRFQFNGASLRSPVWISDPVTWLGEWRCYIVRGEVVGVRPYSGDETAPLDLEVVQAAADAYTDAPWGHALDFGVLSTGQTALVEANHGYSLGSYGLDPQLYLDVLVAYWEWLFSDVSARSSDAGAASHTPVPMDAPRPED